MKQIMRFLVLTFFLHCLAIQTLQAKIYVGRIIDTQASTLPCDMTVGIFEGTGTTLAGIFTFITSALCTNCVATSEIISQGSLSLISTNAQKITISGEYNNVTNSTIANISINAPTQALERRYITVSGTSTITLFSVTTYVTLTVVGNNVIINGSSIPEGVYELVPNQVFP